MNDSEARPDIAENRTETAQGAPFVYLRSLTPGLRRSKPSGQNSPSREPFELDDAALAASDPASLSTSELVREVKRLRSRVAAVEANAEVLSVARHDLMVEVDGKTAMLRRATDDIPFGPVHADAGDLHETALLLDRLAAYMKGQDDRLVAMGDKADGFLRRAEQAEQDREAFRVTGHVLEDNLAQAEAERAVARKSAVHYRDTLFEVRDDILDVRGHNRLSIADTVWHGAAETTVDFINAALTAIPADKPRCRVVTSPRFYGVEDRDRAIEALEDAAHSGRANAGMTRRYYMGETVDVVAEALGMRRAGA